jgi:hypothetical protein
MKTALTNINKERKADSKKEFTYYNFLYVNTRTAINNIYCFISVYTYCNKDSFKRGQINPFLMINKEPIGVIGDAQPLKQNSTYDAADLAAPVNAFKYCWSKWLAILSSLNFSLLFSGSKYSLVPCKIECPKYHSQYKIPGQQIK